jgi:hypothetical protein
MRTRSLVGRYAVVLLNGEKIVQLGNLKPGIFVGLSMAPSVMDSVKTTGGKR